MFATIHRLLGNDSGVTAIEYALIGSFIAVVIAVAVNTAGSAVSSTFSTVAGSF